MLKYAIAAVCLLALGFMTLPARAADSSSLSKKDQKFIKDAATGGKEEVALGNFAAQRASNPQVKQFAQRMVNDHSKANDQLMQLVNNKGVDLSMNKDKTDKKIQDIKNKLSKYQGADFDKHYMDMMVKDHQKDVHEFEQASKDAQDPQVKSFATQTLPTLQEHLQLAEQIKAKLGE